MNDWITIAHTVGDLASLAAAVVTLVTVLIDRDKRK